MRSTNQIFGSKNGIDSIEKTNLLLKSLRMYDTVELFYSFFAPYFKNHAWKI